MGRLNSRTLATIQPPVSIPTYDRRGLTVGIVHFGVGAFHRAHEAMYLDRVLRRDPTAPWGICGVGLLPFDIQVRDALRDQDCLYTLVTKSPNGTAEPRIIGSIVEYLYAPDDPEAVLQELTAPSTRIVSLTITEGGYLINEAGEFDSSSPDVAADLNGGQPPRTVFGYLTEALRRRRDVGVPPFTIMSCDNIQTNGEVARLALTSFAGLIDAQLGAWIQTHVSFPNSMVDRITPATTDERRLEVSASYGIDDRWPIISESFEQWVLEDKFPSGRPPLETVGVQVVRDVEPYELMKLRLLNASHQAMSYLGILAGQTHVDEVCRMPEFIEFLDGYMTLEATPTLKPVPGIDIPAYRAELIERFSNSTIADTLARQAVDASSRIPKFLLPVLRAQLTAGGPIDHICLVIAAWSVYLGGRSEQGDAIQPVDRRLSELREAVQAETDHPGALLDLTGVFGDLGQNARFRGTYLHFRQKLKGDGALAAIAVVNAASAPACPSQSELAQE